MESDACESALRASGQPACPKGRFIGGRLRSLRRLLAALAVLLASCAGSIKDQRNAYSYLGRIAEAAEDVVTEPRSRATNDPTPAGLRSTNPRAADIYDALPKTKKETYQRYKVALEQGETIILRSYVEGLAAGDCVRIWIAGPGLSPVYWYAPDQAQLERSTECKRPDKVKD